MNKIIVVIASAVAVLIDATGSGTAFNYRGTGTDTHGRQPVVETTDIRVKRPFKR